MHTSSDVRYSPRSLYRQVLGHAFDQLPAELQAFHSLSGEHRLEGECHIVGPTSLLGRAVARLFGLPATSGKFRLAFDLSAGEHEEQWKRHFPHRPMTSVLRIARGALTERLGPVDLHFRLQATPTTLQMHLERVTCCGIPCPRFLIPQTVAVESASPGKLHFHVSARLPFVGLLTEYRGHLHLS